MVRIRIAGAVVDAGLGHRAADDWFDDGVTELIVGGLAIKI